MPEGRRLAGLARTGTVATCLTALLGGCGSIGDPLPPLTNVPSPVGDLAASQSGNSITIAWTWPPKTVEGTEARRIGEFALWVIDVPNFSEELTAETLDEYRRPVAKLAGTDLEAQGPGDRLELRTRLEEWTLGQTSVLVVTATNRAGQHAGYSNQVRIQPLESPTAPVMKPPVATANGVSLQWRLAERAEEYAIERAQGEDGEFVALGRLATDSFLDRTARWGQAYRYRLRPLRNTEAGWIEGPLSAPVSVTPRDVFAPQAPRGLRAVRTPGTIELSWRPGDDEDPAAYRVFRGGKAVATLAGQTSYSDAAVDAGTPYEYAVTAVDAGGNESLPAGPLAVPPAEP